MSQDHAADSREPPPATDAVTSPDSPAPDSHEAGSPKATSPEPDKQQQRKQVLLRLDPAVHAALQTWAASELRSVNAQIELLLRQALREANRLPHEVRPMPRRGRPTRDQTRDE